MSWLRVDDHEVLDSRVGELDHNLYRARHALMQLCAREYRDDGIFPAKRIVHAAYATPAGPKSLTRAGLARLRELGFVRSRDEYTNDETDGLALTWPDDGQEWLRVHKWEVYNPPRDKTVAERVRRFRERKKDESNDEGNALQDEGGNGESNALRNAPVTRARAQAGARVPVPSPSRKSVSSSLLSTSSAANGGTDHTHNNTYNHALEQLIDACGGTQDARKKLTADHAHYGGAEARLEAIRWAIEQPGTKSRLAKARAMLKDRSGEPGTTDREPTLGGDPEPVLGDAGAHPPPDEGGA